MLNANCRKSFRLNAYLQLDIPQFKVVSGLEGFLVGLQQSAAESAEGITSWFHCCLWTVSLGITQLSKYNCHMLMLYSSQWHYREYSHVS